MALLSHKVQVELRIQVVAAVVVTLQAALQQLTAGAVALV
jgi:hypothetical protein